MQEFLTHPYTIIYLLGILASYIFWGINHGDPKYPGEVRVKHLLLGWFNHSFEPSSGDSGGFVFYGTLAWPLTVFATIVILVCVGCVYGISWTLKQLFRITRINIIFDKLMNIKINFNYITKPISRISEKLFSKLEYIADWIVHKQEGKS